MGEKSFITNEEIDFLLTVVDEVMNRTHIVIPFQKEEQVKNYKGHLMYQLMYKELPVNPFIRKDILTELRGIMLNRLWLSRVEPATPVGVNAGTSIVGPATQMTLSSFHQNGVLSAATMGIAKFFEILYSIANPQEVNMTLYFKERVNYDEAYQYRLMFEEVCLTNLIKSYTIEPYIEKDIREQHELFIDVMGFKIPIQDVECTHYMEIELDVLKLYEYRITIQKIVEELEHFRPGLYKYIYSSIDEGMLYIFPDVQKCLSHFEAITISNEDCCHVYLETETKRTFNEIIISGIRKIEKMFIQKFKVSSIISHSIKITNKLILSLIGQQNIILKEGDYPYVEGMKCEVKSKGKITKISFKDSRRILDLIKSKDITEEIEKYGFHIKEGNVEEYSISYFIETEDIEKYVSELKDYGYEIQRIDIYESEIRLNTKDTSIKELAIIQELGGEIYEDDIGIIIFVQGDINSEIKFQLRKLKVEKNVIQRKRIIIGKNYKFEIINPSSLEKLGYFGVIDDKGILVHRYDSYFIYLNRIEMVLKGIKKQDLIEFLMVIGYYTLEFKDLYNNDVILVLIPRKNDFLQHTKFKEQMYTNISTKEPLAYCNLVLEKDEEEENEHEAKIKLMKIDEEEDFIKKVQLINYLRAPNNISKYGYVYILETIGSNIPGIFQYSEIFDVVRSWSSAVHETKACLGLYAARTLMLRTMFKLIEGYGVNPSHPMLLIDDMINGGVITSAKYISSSKQVTGGLINASHQRVSENIIKSAVLGSSESTSSVAVSIFMGNIIKQGTGMTTILEDEKEKERLLSLRTKKSDIEEHRKKLRELIQAKPVVRRTLGIKISDFPVEERRMVNQIGDPENKPDELEEDEEEFLETGLTVEEAKSELVDSDLDNEFPPYIKITIPTCVLDVMPDILLKEIEGITKVSSSKQTSLIFTPQQQIKPEQKQTFVMKGRQVTNIASLNLASQMIQTQASSSTQIPTYTQSKPSMPVQSSTQKSMTFSLLKPQASILVQSSTPIIQTQGIKHGFVPYMQNLFSQLDINNIMIDRNLIAYEEEGLNFVTYLNSSDELTRWILSSTNEKTIIDSSCSIGGDTIGFLLNSKKYGKQFEKVVSIELNQLRYLCLLENIKLYKIDRFVEHYNVNLLDWFKEEYKKYPNSVLYMDPPWGGKEYKQFRVIPDLYYNYGTQTYSFSTLLKEIISSKFFKFIFLKLPNNIDRDIFRGYRTEYKESGSILFVKIVV